MSGDHINASVGGDVHGQMAVGKDIRQMNVVGAPLTQEERAELAG
jgi:hypothetical protein